MVSDDLISIGSCFRSLVEPNYAGNIIVNLASLPDFLRKPILKKRMMEFFSMAKDEKNEVIDNALAAGPTIPFPNFSKLFKTWLEVLTTLEVAQRNELFSAYIYEVVRNPQKLIMFNLDGILEIFLTLSDEQKRILTKSIQDIINSLDKEQKRRILLVIPDNARMQMGI